MNEEQRKAAALQLAATIAAPVLLAEFNNGNLEKMEAFLRKSADTFRPIIDRYLDQPKA